MTTAVTSLPVAVVGLGTWQLDRAAPATAIAALRRGIELGLTHIDTAEMYGSGAAESLVGKAIDGQRDQVWLASKVLPSNASRPGTVAACEASLRRLGTDRLDLYMLHWPSHHPLEETFAAFEQLVAQGKILRYGVSNFDVDMLEQVYPVAGPGKLACNQVLYHLEERYIEHAVIPWCQAHDVPVVAYSPFGSGSFPSAGAGPTTLRRIAQRHQATPHQIALQFLLRHEGLWTIPKAARQAHVEDNAAALQVELAAEDQRLLDEAFPRGAPGGSLPII
ncbi:MAG: aldo/keto reductase [Deltaproteobacteria bacterium]|nr:aldo/keto reductase [Deltaproteobacteria bacterium]